MAERHRIHVSGELDGGNLLCPYTALLPITNMSKVDAEQCSIFLCPTSSNQGSCKIAGCSEGYSLFG